MIYTDYVPILHSDYDAWRSNTLGNGYNVIADTSGCLALDFANEFWYNIGFPEGYPYTANTNNPYEVWTYATENRSYDGVLYFDIISDINDVKRGDVIIFNTAYTPVRGHIGFADAVYSGNNTISLLSQDNGGTPAPEGGSLVNVANFTFGDNAVFLGALRYRPWHQTPPTPSRPGGFRKRLPLILTARKQQNQNIL